MGDDSLKDIMDMAVDAAKPYVEKIEPTIKKAKEKAKSAVKKAKEKVEPAVKKAKEKVEPAVKKARQKADPVIKEAAKQTSRLLAKTETYIQFGDIELNTNYISDKVRSDYEEREDSKTIKKLRIYIKPEERKAYYVVNDNSTGSIDL